MPYALRRPVLFQFFCLGCALRNHRDRPQPGAAWDHSSERPNELDISVLREKKDVSAPRSCHNAVFGRYGSKGNASRQGRSNRFGGISCTPHDIGGCPNARESSSIAEIDGARHGCLLGSGAIRCRFVRQQKFLWGRRGNAETPGISDRKALASFRGYHRAAEGEAAYALWCPVSCRQHVSCCLRLCPGWAWHTSVVL